MWQERRPAVTSRPARRDPISRERWCKFAFVLIGFLAVGSEARARSLSQESRVQAQVAIERVYWAHRIWPGENSGGKPAFEVAVPMGVIRSRVADYLEKSSALEELWDRPLTGSQLQAEVERMVRRTRRP